MHDLPIDGWDTLHVPILLEILSQCGFWNTCGIFNLWLIAVEDCKECESISDICTMVGIATINNLHKIRVHIIYYISKSCYIIYVD